jgi:hypothetical protein
MYYTTVLMVWHTLCKLKCNRIFDSFDVHGGVERGHYDATIDHLVEFGAGLDIEHHDFASFANQNVDHLELLDLIDQLYTRFDDLAHSSKIIEKKKNSGGPE